MQFVDERIGDRKMRNSEVHVNVTPRGQYRSLKVL